MSAVWSVAIVDADGGKEIFVGREDGTLEKFAGKMLKANPPVATLSLPNLHAGAITSISAASGDEVTTASLDGTVKVVSTTAEVEGKREQKSTDIGAGVRCMLVAGEQTFVGAQDNNIHVLGGEATQVLSGHSDYVSALSMGEVNLFSASYDNTVRVWDVAAAKTLFVLTGHTNAVKVVQSVGSYIYTASRDETLRVWALPDAEADAEAGGGGGAGAPGEEGAEGEGQAAAEGEPIVSPDAVPQVHATAVIELPNTPHSAALSGSNIYIGFTDHSVRVISTRDLSKNVQNFAADGKSRFRKCAKHLEANAAVSVKNLKTIHKKTLKAKKKELLDGAAAAAKAAADAAREERRAAAAAAAENADEEDAEPEPEPEGEEEEQEIALTEDQEKELADFTEAESAELEKKIANVHAVKAEKIAALAPISQKSFLCEREKFDRVSFTRSYGTGGNQAVVTLAVDGITAYVAAGSEVSTVDCRPGVTVL